MIYINCDWPVTDATYQISLKSVHRFWRRCLRFSPYLGMAVPPVPDEKLFKVFTIYGHGGHLGKVT